MTTMRRAATLADAVGAASFTRDLFLSGFASALAAIAAQMEIRLPFTPVPMTLQPLVVFVCGAALGSRRAALAMLLYLAEGIAGLPVFAGGASGVAMLLGPSGGYLLGFVPAAGLIGWFAERGWDRDPWRAALTMTLGCMVVYACGLVQLARFVAPQAVLASGFYPFVAGDLLKVAVAAHSVPVAWRLMERYGLASRA